MTKTTIKLHHMRNYLKCNCKINKFQLTKMKASLISDRSKQNTVLSVYHTLATHPLPH